MTVQEFSQRFTGNGNAEVLFHIGLQEFGVPRRSHIPPQFGGSRGEHEPLDLFLLFFREKRLASGGEISVKQEVEPPRSLEQ
ncbi:hypothetical protein DI43_17790 [Geobacillus sp. CAMR12739]|nr:hypothetical protein DI43_17790 [Geobacillus sp. CAMR12739]